MASPMEPVVQLSNKYAEQFSTTFESVRLRGINLQQDAQVKANELQQQAQGVAGQVEAQARGIQSTLVAALSDMSPAPQDSGPRLLEVHSWVAVCLFAATIGRVLGGLLAPALAVLFDGYIALILGTFALPTWMYFYNKSSASEGLSEDDRRMVLLGISTAMGLLDGFVFAERYMVSASPLAALGFAASAVAAVVLAQQHGNRTVFLGATIGGAAAVHLVLGLVLGLSFSYLLEVSLQAGIVFVATQFYIAHSGGSLRAIDLVRHQTVLVGAVCLSQMIVTGVFSTDKDGYAAAQNAQQQA